MNFEQALEYLLSLGHETVAIKLGLRNTELLLQNLGEPQKSFQSVQIAGTNGKGSTAVILDSISRSAATRTGLYTSPHLISITERIKIDGCEISESEFAELATEVRRVAESLVAAGQLEALPTFFEQVTAIACLAFKRAGTELAILETGLGGRLDATTVAAAKTVAIASIALDHQQYLGETLAEIAAEKAAIIRPGVQAFISAQPPDALEVLLKRCAETGVFPNIIEEPSIESATQDGRFTVTLETNEDRYEHLTIGLRGRHQIQNASLALHIAESLRGEGLAIRKSAIIEGIEKAEYAGRLELHEGAPSMLLDGAHNPAGARALRQYLDEFVSAPVTLVFGAMADKQLDQMAQVLFSKAAHLILTAPDHPRAAMPDSLRELASNVVDRKNISTIVDVQQALQKAKELTASEGLICVTGSLYLIGEIKAAMRATAQTLAAS